MQPLEIAVLDRGLDLGAGMSKAEEQQFVVLFVAHPTIEALAEAVLHQLARRDVMPLYANFPAPCQHRMAGQLSAIVADEPVRLAELGDWLGELTYDTAARHGGVRPRRQALSSAAIHDVEHAEPSA